MILRHNLASILVPPIGHQVDVEPNLKLGYVGSFARALNLCHILGGGFEGNFTVKDIDTRQVKAQNHGNLSFKTSSTLLRKISRVI